MMKCSEGPRGTQYINNLKVIKEEADDEDKSDTHSLDSDPSQESRDAQEERKEAIDSQFIPLQIDGQVLARNELSKVDNKRGLREGLH